MGCEVCMHSIKLNCYLDKLNLLLDQRCVATTEVTAESHPIKCVATGDQSAVRIPKATQIHMYMYEMQRAQLFTMMEDK